MRHVFLIAGGWSEAPDGGHRRVFRPARDYPGGQPPSLEGNLESAARHALAQARVDLGGRVSHLLVTTMPDVWREDLSLGLFATRLKTRLGLGTACQARFEVGSSDAGAGVFASAVRTLREADAPGTALVLAGQAMPGGHHAIRAIARVLDPRDRDAWLNMLNVGDLMLDVHSRWWGLDEAARRLCAGDYVGALLDHKLALARAYPAATRSRDERPRVLSPWSTPRMRLFDIAPAVNGAAAALLTTDTALVEAWIAANGSSRVVRVLGVGEGEADTAVSRRPEPFFHQGAVHQALAELCRDAGTNRDFLRASAFAVLHDAFPSIELAFLGALGFTPAAAVQRALTWWPNPVGGLTTFGHCLGASGLVQIVAALHTFLCPAHLVRDPTWPDFTGAAVPVHGLCASVGGPLTHVVASLLQSVSAESAWATPFSPAQRHRFRPGLAHEYRRRGSWLAHLEQEHLAVLPPQTGILEARTRLHLSALPLPLPAALLAGWEPGPLRVRDATVDVPEELARQCRQTLSGPFPDDPELRRAWATALARKLGGDESAVAAAIQADLPPWVGLVRSAAGRQLCLLADAVAAAPPGTLVHLEPAEPMPVADRTVPLPGLVPAWYPPVVPGPERCVLASHAASAIAAIQRLRRNALDSSILDDVRALASAAAHACRATPELPPPPTAVRLFRSLVSPDPDPRDLARQLEALAAVAPEAPRRPMAYCEFDVVASATRRTEDDADTLNRVGRALLAAEGWLAGAELTWARRADAFCVTLHDPQRARHPDQSAVAVLRFARDAYQACLDAGIPLRAVVWLGDGYPFFEVTGQYAVASSGQRMARRVIRGAPAFHVDTVKHGVALMWSRTCGADDPHCQDDARTWLDATWARVGGEQLAPVGEVEPVQRPDGRVLYYQVRRRIPPAG